MALNLTLNNLELPVRVSSTWVESSSRRVRQRTSHFKSICDSILCDFQGQLQGHQKSAWCIWFAAYTLPILIQIGCTVLQLFNCIIFVTYSITQLIAMGPSRKNVWFPVTRPTLVFSADPEVFWPFYKIKILVPDPAIFSALSHFLYLAILSVFDTFSMEYLCREMCRQLKPARKIISVLSQPTLYSQLYCY